MTALGVLCCFALFICLTLLASFFLPSHLSFNNMYTRCLVLYVYTRCLVLYVYTRCLVLYVYTRCLVLYVYTRCLVLYVYTRCLVLYVYTRCLVLYVYTRCLVLYVYTRCLVLYVYTRCLVLYVYTRCLVLYMYTPGVLDLHSFVWRHGTVYRGLFHNLASKLTFSTNNRAVQATTVVAFFLITVCFAYIRTLP